MKSGNLLRLSEVFAMPMPKAIVAALALLSLASFGCSKTYIPNTDVEDSGENRKVIKFCEDYRHAVEERNVGRLLSMVSPQYHEDGGNSANDDDLDYDGYKEFMTTTFQQT